MAKAKKQQKSKQIKKQPKRSAGINRAAEYANLLLNPEYAPISGAFHMGECGVIQRFVADYTLNTGATDTAGFLYICPSINAIGYGTYVTSATTFTNTMVYNNSNSPGAALLGNASRIRGLAAKIELLPIGATADAMTGEVVTGNASVRVVGATTTVDGFFSHGAARDVLTKRVYATVFKPGKADHEFAANSDLLDASDGNVVFVAYRGAPAGKSITVRLVTVIEWTPHTGAQLLHATTSTTNPVDTHRVITAMDGKHSHWWHDLKQGVLKDMSNVARYGVRMGLTYATQQAQSALFGAARSTPLLLAAA